MRQTQIQTTPQNFAPIHHTNAYVYVVVGTFYLGTYVEDTERHIASQNITLQQILHVYVENFDAVSVPRIGAIYQMSQIIISYRCDATGHGMPL